MKTFDIVVMTAISVGTIFMILCAVILVKETWFNKNKK